MNIHRLKNRADFVRLTHVGRKHVYPAFIAQTSPNGLDCWRVGFTASKKVGNAVARSRAKRRLRALVDKVMRLNPAFHALPHDLVLVARGPVLEKDFQEMQTQLEKVITQCGNA